MGSTERSSIVDQLQQEMEDLSQLQYSADFSADINSKMQMPSRLSMAPEIDSFLDDTLRQNDGPSASPAHAMEVPERILLAGSGSHVGLRDTPRNLDLDEIPAFTAQHNVALATPPRTLTLDEFSFPTVGTESEKGVSKQNQERGAIQPGDDSDLVHLQTKLKSLSKKVMHLEEQDRYRDKKEQMLIVLGLLYVLYKGVTFFRQS